METQWTPTKHGGFRRHTRLPQKMGKAQETSGQAEDIARSGVENGAGSAQYLVEDLPNTKAVGGSSPSPRTKKFTIKFRERLGLPTCPYLIRWRVETPWGSVRLHHWLGPDDDRAKHDHPWGFRTFVLKGGYTDASPCAPCGGMGHDFVGNGVFDCPYCNGTGEIRQHLHAPATQYRVAEHRHTVFPDPSGCWTVIVTGPKVRNWGFWVKGKFVKMNKYFLTYGHHPCD